MSVSVDIRLHTGAFSLDASFQSDAGATAILGASGAGKTLTLRAIAGLQTPLEGKILQRGVTLYNSEQRIDLPARRRNVGYLFQDYALFPHLTVAENIAFGLKGREQADQRESVSRMVDLLRLHGLEDRHPAGLSGGERQRVALGRALAPHPDLLLLDEPFSALDAPNRDSLVEEFIALREAIDVPMILVTHDIGEAYALAEHLVVMGGGRVLQSGPRAEVFHRPASPDVARLVGVQNIFNDVRGGSPVVVGVRAADMLVTSGPEPDATLNQTIDRGTQLLGRFTTDHGDQLVAELDRSRFANLMPGSRWRVEAREGTSLVWPASLGI
ncbi:MAG: ATP-binding cassette domain-containing protein [Chloroflexi bacterium]|nr:ATP-binding cassette domain-containing protein [Chloroflexota bacterium]MDA1174588.1 ATP-binding cassette domain-containing protein [Chloroflexota bacterium]